jgi:hypothetical protein
MLHLQLLLVTNRRDLTIDYVNKSTRPRVNEPAWLMSERVRLHPWEEKNAESED